MLQITNTVINKDGQLVKDKIVYAVHYVITNDVITSIQCAISSDIEGVFDQIGYIRKENGRLTTDFKEQVDAVGHLSIFEDIAKEIDLELPKAERKIKG